jgi:superfamily II DNA or RNA helicase
MDARDQFRMKEDLSIIPKVQSFGKKEVEPKVIKLFKIAKSNIDGYGFIGIPRGYFFEVWPKRAINKYTYEIENRIPEHELLSSVSCTYTLRPEDQAPDVSKFIELHKLQYESRGFSLGIFDAFTGYGKGVVGCEFIRILRYRAIVLVHQAALMDQWIENIKRYCPDWTVGKVGGGKTDFEGKDIVVGTIQTLMQDDLSRLGKDFFKSFGTVLCDEIHRMGGEKFGSVIPKFHAKHVIGTSGTVRRADGCENVFKYVTGDVLVKGNQINRQFPIVYIRNTGFSTSARTAGLEKPQLLSMIEKNMDRAKLIANDVYKCLLAKRHPLIMSERLEILHRVQICLDAICKENGLEFTHGFYIGGKKKHELDEAAKADVVYATSQLAKEGIDIPRLCSIFLVTSCSDPEQSIGRVLRRHPGKKTPMVVDYVDFNIAKFVSSYNSRMRLYRGLKWKVIGAVK